MNVWKPHFISYFSRSVKYNFLKTNNVPFLGFHQVENQGLNPHMYMSAHLVILVDFFLQEEGEGTKTIGDLNTPQEENNKFKVRTWNSTLSLFSSFYLQKNMSSILDLSPRKLELESKLDLKFQGDGKLSTKKKKQPSLGPAPKIVKTLNV